MLIFFKKKRSHGVPHFKSKKYHELNTENPHMYKNTHLVSVSFGVILKQN